MFRDFPVAVKIPADVTAISASVLSFFMAIPWSGISAFFATIYMILRIYYIYKNKGNESGR